MISWDTTESFLYAGCDRTKFRTQVADVTREPDTEFQMVATITMHDKLTIRPPSNKVKVLLNLDQISRLNIKRVQVCLHEAQQPGELVALQKYRVNSGREKAWCFEHTFPLKISSKDISSYSSSTLWPFSRPFSGIAGGAKQLRSFFSFGPVWLLMLHVGEDDPEETGVLPMGYTSLRKWNLHLFTASRFCARAIFSST